MVRARDPHARSAGGAVQLGELLGVPDVHGAVAPSGLTRRSRRLALALAAVAVLVAAAGAISFARFVAQAKHDPGFAYRDGATLARVYKQARAAEDRGDRPSAVVGYRFIVAVGAGRDSALALYVAAARAGLERLGVRVTPAGLDTLPDPAR